MYVCVCVCVCVYVHNGERDAAETEQQKPRNSSLPKKTNPPTAPFSKKDRKKNR